MCAGGVEGYVCAGVLRWMCELGVLRGCVRWGVEGDVCTGVLRFICVLGC